VAFRDAHEAVGQAVRYAVGKGCELSQLSITELRRFCAEVGPDVKSVLTLEGSVAARSHFGGTAPTAVRRAVARAERRLAAEAGPGRRRRSGVR
jgi:argininosuccinate lyase